MLLFKAEHVPMILDGRKTQTRRAWKRCRVRVGSVHKCYSGGMPFSSCPECCGAGWEPADVGIAPCCVCDGTGKLQPFASIRIKRVWLERLTEIPEADAITEGYPTVAKFHEAFIRINGLKEGHIFEGPVWAVEFEVVG
jgi:hypothetical protein